MAELTVEFEKLWDVNEGICLHLQGVIDVTTDRRFRQILQSTLEAGHANLVLDMEQITFINSNGMGSLVWLHDSLDGIGGYVLLKLRPHIHDLASALGIDMFYRNVGSLEEAITTLSSDGDAES